MAPGRKGMDVADSRGRGGVHGHTLHDLAEDNMLPVEVWSWPCEAEREMCSMAPSHQAMWIDFRGRMESEGAHSATCASGKGKQGLELGGSHSLAIMKNWLPFVFLPAFAMETRPGRSCLILKFSSAQRVDHSP